MISIDLKNKESNPLLFPLVRGTCAKHDERLYAACTQPSDLPTPLQRGGISGVYRINHPKREVFRDSDR